MSMASKKSLNSGKHAKSLRRSSRPSNPEWEFLEERFSTMSTDFGQLARMFGNQS